MGSSSASVELNLSLKPSYVPKTIANLLTDLSKVGNASDKLAVLNDYINQYEEELNSIVAFKRQLPQCMLLLMEALDTLRIEFMNIKNGMESEATAGRPLMEFLAIKRKHYEEKQTDVSAADQKYNNKGKSCLMSSSYQLWNSNHENKKQKTFMDFIQVRNQNPISFKESSFRSSLAENGFSSRENNIRGSHSRFASVGTNNGHVGLNLKADDQSLNYYPRPLTQPIWKNNRRTWSAELHARFVEALNLLGGIEVATPKQIREVMQVEGLTNDQVKSHLQKYRLHCRRLPAGRYAECMVNFQDPWHPQIYLSDPLASEDSDENNSKAEGSPSRKS
ncbi:hypothetical protein DITRI_Ditri13aG0157800 [Diplodiscus trichospermus]